MITANYKVYYGVHLNHWTESWGGTDYHKLLIKEYMDDEIISTATESSAATVTFLLPELVKSSYYLNGRASGHFKIYNKSTSTPTDITGYTATIIKINNVGTETDLGTHTEVIAADNSVATDSFIAIPFFINLSKAEVLENEKLAFSLVITGGSDLCFAFDNWADTEDLKIEIPFAPTTGG